MMPPMSTATPEPQGDARPPSPARRRQLERWHEQAITLTLLEIPEFRRKAGLAPRNGGSSLAEMARALGMHRQQISAIEESALKKLRSIAYEDADLSDEVQRSRH